MGCKGVFVTRTCFRDDYVASVFSLGARDRLRYFIVALPVHSINLFCKQNLRIIGLINELDQIEYSHMLEKLILSTVLRSAHTNKRDFNQI